MIGYMFPGTVKNGGTPLLGRARKPRVGASMQAAELHDFETVLDTNPYVDARVDRNESWFA